MCVGVREWRVRECVCVGWGLGSGGSGGNVGGGGLGSGGSQQRREVIEKLKTRHTFILPPKTLVTRNILHQTKIHVYNTSARRMSNNPPSVYLFHSNP